MVTKETEQQIRERMIKRHAEKMEARRRDEQTLHISINGKGYYTSVPCSEESGWVEDD